MRHLVEDSVARGLKVLELLTRLAPAAALVAVVILRVEVVRGPGGREKERADLHLAAGDVVDGRCRVGDGEAVGLISSATIDTAYGELVGGSGRIVIHCDRCPEVRRVAFVVLAEVMCEAVITYCKVFFFFFPGDTKGLRSAFIVNALRNFSQCRSIVKSFLDPVRVTSAINNFVRVVSTEKRMRHSINDSRR